MKLNAIVKQLASVIVEVVAPVSIADANQSCLVHCKPSNEVKIFFFFRVI